MLAPYHILMRRIAGFTLVELLVTITVLGILLAVAAPSYTTMLEKRRLIAATEGVYAHLQFARSEAVKFGGSSDNLNVRIQVGTPWCMGISNTEDCDCNIVGNSVGACVFGPTGSTTQRNLSGNEFSNVVLTTNEDNIQIDRIRGAIPPGAVGHITLTSTPSGLITKVYFSRMGRFKICSDSHVGGYPSC